MEPEGSNTSDRYLVDAWNNYHHSMDQANKAAKSLGKDLGREASKKILMRKTKAQLIDMIIAMEQTPPQADWKERYDNAREDISRLREKYQKTVHILHKSDRRISTLEQANSELQAMIRHEYLRKQKAVESNNKEFDKQGPKNRFDRQEAEIARQRAAFRIVASAGVFGLTLLGTLAATIFLSTGDQLVFNIVCGIFGSLAGLYYVWSVARANVMGAQVRNLDWQYVMWLDLKEEKELEEHEAKLKAAEKELEA